MPDFTTEQFILAAVVVLAVHAAFRILTGLLRMAASVAAIAGLWVLVFHPGMPDGQEINARVAELSPKAKLAVAEFSRCFSQVVASIGRGSESECKQRAMAYLQQIGGQQYAEEAIQAIEAYLEGARRVEM